MDEPPGDELLKPSGLPMVEVFGYPPGNFSDAAVAARASKHCPFKDGPCTKVSVKDPLGVCSIWDSGRIVVTCPVRFRQDGQFLDDLRTLFFRPGESVRALAEKTLRDAAGRPIGNSDFLLQSQHDPSRLVFVEMQGTYISGAIGAAFRWYMEDPTNHALGKWPKKSWPRADFLSSSRKRLFPQLVAKGNATVSTWGKTQAVVVDRPFFDAMRGADLPTARPEAANLVWLIYRVEPGVDNRLTLELDEVVYTDYETCMPIMSTPAPGRLEDFLSSL